MASKNKPDPILVKDQLQALQTALAAYGPKYFMRLMFWILTKEEQTLGLSGRRSIVVPFRLNPMQESVENNLGRNNLLVKPRQPGGTTYFLLRRGLLPVITTPGCGALLISQNHKYAQKHFQIARRAYRHIGALDPFNDAVNDLSISLKENLLHTEYSNSKELIFSQLDSRFMIESAEVEEAGQGFTIHHLICSEYSRWPRDPAETLSNARGALVPNGTTDKECTANGAVGPFFKDCMLALDDPEESDATLHFFPWWIVPEYRLDISPEQQAEIAKDLKSDEDKLVKNFHLDMKQIAWRRQTIREQRGNFDEKYPEDLVTAFLVIGNAYFDKDVLIARKRELTTFKPWMSAHEGKAVFFHPRVATRRYLIGADIATGRQISTQDTDYCAAVCIDLETGEEMASLRDRLTPQDFAYDLAQLGRYYNDALIAVERTGDGGTVIVTLASECGYSNIYKHRELLKRNHQKRIIELEGFPTTTKTRPIALNFVNRFILEHPDLIWDEQFINEALVFVRDEKGTPRAQEGAHDDTVSARWVAHGARMATLNYWDPTAGKSEGYVTHDRLTNLEEYEVAEEHVA